MSFVIELDQEQTKLSFSLHSKADLGDIRLVRAQLVCARRLSEIKKGLVFDVDYESDSARFLDESLLVTTRFEFRIAEEEASGAPSLISVGCSFEAKYDLIEGYVPTREEIDAFRSGNAIFNCWPFFREYIQSTLTRMGYPPPPVSFLRLAAKAEPTADSAADESLQHGPEKRSKGVPKKRRP